MTFAVIKTGGKQYKVSKGDSLRIEKVKEKQLIEGGKISFNEVLLIDDGKRDQRWTPQ
jgi:large subunit ribosomal protein L21